MSTFLDGELAKRALQKIHELRAQGWEIESARALPLPDEGPPSAPRIVVMFTTAKEAKYETSIATALYLAVPRVAFVSPKSTGPYLDGVVERLRQMFSKESDGVVLWKKPSPRSKR